MLVHVDSRSCLRIFLIALLSFSVHALNNFVDNYETLSYAAVNTARLKRSAAGDESPYSRPVRIRFNSYNRTFTLNLRRIDRETSIFHDNLIVDDGVETHDIRPHDFLYEGFAEGDPHSRVYGSLLDGVFDGHIHLSDGHSFTVDKATKYFDLSSRPTHYHSIIYHDVDITHKSFRYKRETIDEDEGVDSGKKVCGLGGQTEESMRSFQKTGSTIYSAEHDHDTITISRRRESRSPKKDAQGRYLVRACSMYFQADHKLYNEIYMKEGNRDDVRTREEIISMFYTHVKAVNEIYETTNFQGITGLHFVIQRVSVYTPSHCHAGSPSPGSDNPFCEENVDVSNYLNLNSQKNHSAFCLAYALTFRDFVGGTLGLAWVASPQTNTAGGICQVHQHYNEGSRGNVFRSLNTGIVTLVNYGNRVPPRVSQLTLAHEIGHNFGSPHDFPVECQPGLPQGNFIMFASATSGDKANNARFSQCSIKNISQVLDVVLRSRPIDPSLSQGMTQYKRNCFQERKSAFCGNQIWEENEECDCGFNQADCDTIGDKCCVPLEASRDKDSPGACKKKKGARCSPSQGFCCNGATCDLYQARDSQPCRSETECAEQQFCDGLSTKCPESAPKRDRIPCQDSTKVCSGGNCNGSLCEVFGLRDCFLTDGAPDKLCFLACIKNGKCTSSVDLIEFAANRTHYIQNGRHGHKGIVLRPGSPCNNYKGYCDIFRKCRSVDSNGPLARLKHLIFDEKTIETVSLWAQEKWWALVGAALMVLLLLAMFVKCCAVHTPSTNPNKPPALSLYNTLSRPSTLIRQRRGQRAAARSAAAAANGVSSASVPPSSSRNAPTANARGVSSSAAVRPSAPPLLPSAPPMLPTTAMPAPPPAVLVMEPPPPYSAAAHPASALGGPKRGHRNNKKRQTSADTRPKSSR